MWLDSVYRVTVEKRGAKEVTVKSTGHDRLRITVLLAARADGTKLKPMIIIPRKRPIAVLDANKKILVLYGDNQSWMDEAKSIMFLEKLIGKDIFGRRRLVNYIVYNGFISCQTLYYVCFEYLNVIM